MEEDTYSYINQIDLINWDYLGEYGHASTIDHEGEMWECPDLSKKQADPPPQYRI